MPIIKQEMNEVESGKRFCYRCGSDEGQLTGCKVWGTMYKRHLWSVNILEKEFIDSVWEILKGDHTDLKRQKMILGDFREVLQQALTTQKETYKNCKECKLCQEHTH